MVQPKIDTIKMTRSIREKNSEQLRHLSRTERLAFYREQASLMNKKAATLVKADPHRPAQP